MLVGFGASLFKIKISFLEPSPGSSSFKKNFFQALFLNLGGRSESYALSCFYSSGVEKTKTSLSF